jgi:hypothetical protein
MLIILAILDVVSFIINWDNPSIIAILCGVSWFLTIIATPVAIIENWNKKIF